MTDAELIGHLWTHRTQDHPTWSDEELMIVRGEGVYVWNSRGRRLFDAYAGLAVVNVGHGRAEIAEAMREQATKLAYYPTTRQFSNPPAARLAARLAELAPGDLRYTLFAVSGSEANERAMQIARVYWLKTGRPRKHKVISLTHGYHGATLATLALCGQPDMVQAYEPLTWQGFRKVAPPYPLWHRGTGTDEELVRRCADGLAEAIRQEDPETVAAVILEPCLSSGGCIIPPLGWLERVRDVCDELDVLMIADEVITGFGRTGRWFGVNHEAVVPDLMAIAKGITSGYVPLSGAIAREKLAAAFPPDTRTENVHPNTYCGHPVACAAALANIAIIERENLVENAAVMGARLHAALEARVRDYPIVGEVRSRGLMAAIDFADPVHRDRPLEARLVETLNTRVLEHGYIAMAKDSVFRLAPPLSITAAEVDELAELVAGTVGELQDEVTRAARSRAATA